MKNIMILTALLLTQMVQAQVGINNPNPDQSAILDLSSNEKGLLTPRMRRAERELISNPATGLLVFDTDDQRFYFFNGSVWIALNEMRRDATGPNITHTGNITVTGTVSATNYGLNTSGNGPIPQGGIIMWSGSTPPTGWALCNGNNGTPNLEGRFIVGFDSGNSDYDQPGNRSTGGGTNGEDGGEESVQLMTNQMPSHNHGRGTLANTLGGSHSHTVPVDRHGAGGSNTVYSPVGQNGTAIVDPRTSTAGNHSHAITGSTASAGSGQSHENRPPYYVLAFIMKL